MRCALKDYGTLPKARQRLQRLSLGMSLPVPFGLSYVPLMVGVRALARFSCVVGPFGLKPEINYHASHGDGISLHSPNSNTP
jgi:hypothetical protein